MKTINKLTLSAYGMHVADQIALVSVPLLATIIFGASVEVIGILVACQSMAHLLGSLPFGLIVDRFQAKSIIVAAALVSVCGFAGTSLSIYLDSLIWFGLAVTISGFGIVLFVLAVLSILPQIARPDQLASANAKIEIPKAVTSFAVPLLIGALITSTISQWVFVVATIAALFALGFTSRLPDFPVGKQNHEGILQRVVEGGAFVMKHELLLPITFCAVFWNFAFSVLLVIMVPLIVQVYQLDPGAFGTALSAFGLASIVGSWLAGRFSKSVSPNVILIFGPAISFLALGALLVLPSGLPVTAIYAAFFCLGFGPSMWLIAQNSVRQLVTPANMLGRVNAVIQTAIYGIRPIGALIGGLLTAATSPKTGLLLVVVAFALSLASAVFSQLRNVRRYDDLQVAPAKAT